jgi:hypothetical protein
VTDAALRIEYDVLEVRNDRSAFFNGKQVNAIEFPLGMGGFPATTKIEDKCFDIGSIHRCMNALTIDVMLEEKERIAFKVFKDMVHVEVTGRPQMMAMGSVGLMGTYPAKRHVRVARDGSTFIDESNEFGREWQVRQYEVKLFVEERYPQFPQLLIPPAETHAINQPRLRQGSVDEKALSDKAHEACDHAIDDHNIHKNCVFDVMATGDESNTMIYGVW